MNKNTGVVEIPFPIPTESFEKHRKFHYTSEDRYCDGRRVVIDHIPFVVWIGDKLLMCRAESPIKRRLSKRAR